MPRERRFAPTAAARCGTATTADAAGCRASAAFPPWRLFGLEYFSLVGVGTDGVGPYKVRDPDHFLFRRPNDLKLRAGDTFAGTPGRPLPQPIGHEGDVRVSTIARFLVEPPPPGGSQPTEDPAGITLLAEGFADASKIAFAWDYFQRPVPLAKNPRYQRRRRDDLLGAARRGTGVSRRIDQRRLDTGRGPQVERPAAKCAKSLWRGEGLTLLMSRSGYQ